MLTAIVRFKILEQAHGQSPFRFTVADLDRPVRAKRLDGREILPVYWRLSKHLLSLASVAVCRGNRWGQPRRGNHGDNRAVTFKITTPLYVIGKKKMIRKESD